MDFKPGDIVKRRSTMTRTGDVPEGSLGVIVSIDRPRAEAGRLEPRPIAVAWNDALLVARHFDFELDLFRDAGEIDEVVMQVLRRLVERTERF